MSTIILGVQRSRGTPLWAAVTHDGIAPLALQTGYGGSKPAVRAIRDLRPPWHHWTGVNDCGVLVSVTERAELPTVAGQRPLGEIASAALEGASASEARDRVTALHAGSYDGFRLAIADRKQAFLIVGDGHAPMVPRRPEARFECRALPPGIHVITEFGTEPGHCERERLIRDRLADAPDTNGGFSSKKLFGILSLHAPEPPGQSVCLHDDRPKGRQRRASAVMMLRLSRGSPAHWIWWQYERATGRPSCEGLSRKQRPLRLIG